MSSVASAKSLTKIFQERLKDKLIRARPLHGRTAIFAIHGISPIQRYAFQDAVANSIECYLNAGEDRDPDDTIPNSKKWKTVVHWPNIPVDAQAEVVRPSALRIYQGKDPDKCANVFDVYEGYWSPLSKGKTTPASALNWLLASTLTPANSTAAVPALGTKIAWDIGYVFFMLFVALLAVIAAGVVAFYGWTGLVQTFHSQPNHGIADFIASPIASFAWLPANAYALLAIAVVFGYFSTQMFALGRAWFKRRARTSELRQDIQLAPGETQQQSTFIRGTTGVARFQAWMFLIVILLLLVTGFAAYWLAASINASAIPQLMECAGWVVLAVLGLRFARTAVDWAVENVLGDIQIYTTHDTNSTYFGIRQAIIATVTDALLGVLRMSDDAATAAEPKTYYDAVHIFGHSLGSTVGMDVLIQLAKMAKEDAALETHWKRIKSFVTFGTSLEKTKYFFDVRQPTVSAAQDQWQNDVYGSLFTCDSTAWNVSNDGIYWMNLWYFRDVVANQIVSYASDVTTSAKSFVWDSIAAARPICCNRKLSHAGPFWEWVHSDYLVDPSFWEWIGPMVTDLRAPPCTTPVNNKD